MFAFCEAMNWSNLPVAGGLYDQRPELLDDWFYIFNERAKFEARKRAQEEADRKRQSRKSGRR